MKHESARHSANRSAKNWGAYWSESGNRHWLEILVASWLPGALLGAHFALLLFFLNPRLPFGGAATAGTVALHAVVFGAVGSLAIWPWTRRHHDRALRFLPWSITVALCGAAALGWVHASRYAYYLPSGINVRLIKGAIWLTLSALICFYTALLHTVARRPYGVRSRLAFWMLGMLSLFLLVERRHAYSAPQGTEWAATDAQIELQIEPRSPPVDLLVVGIEAATLDAILPLAEQGSLPFFKRLLDGGTSGRLQSLRPHREDPLWSTVSTGKLPSKHGIVGHRVHGAPLLVGDGQLEISPVAPLGRLARLWSRAQPVDARRLQALPLWDIWSRLGVDTGVIGWPLSAPVPAAGVERGPGSSSASGSPGLRYLVSDSYFTSPGAAQVIWPGELANRARLFRLRSADLDPALLERFGTPAPGVISAALAADLWRSSLATFLLDQSDAADVNFLMLPGLGEVTDSSFGGFLAAEFEGRQRPPYEGAAQAVRAYYSWLDTTLSNLWGQRQPDLLVVVSAFGAESATGWRWLRAELSRQRSLEADFHRSPDGVLLLYGEGVKPNYRMNNAQLVDVVPTLLYALGYPVARDLDGRVLRGAFDPAFLASHPLAFVPTYEVLRDPPVDSAPSATEQAAPQ